MQGNQTIELTDTEILLSVALDQHFENDNCNGVLIAMGEFCSSVDDSGSYKFFFKCKKCEGEITLQ